MDKPTVFFSHSSKDKEMILPIRNTLVKGTGNSVEVFMSSDGESIPFGRNWIHKIEAGLEASQVMFVFVTPNSINTAWIYFEAGFAYSKGIRVIPVGIGVSVGQLKPPLSLLQGFDILSKDSLNNIITVLNQEFNYKFGDVFSDEDYQTIQNILLSVSPIDNTVFERCFSKAEYSYYSVWNEEKKEHEPIDHYFNALLDYVNTNDLDYSYDRKSKTIILFGIEFALIGADGKKMKPDDPVHQIRVQFSTYNFFYTFSKMREVLTAIGLPEKQIIKLAFSKDYAGVSDNMKSSAIVCQHEDLFSLAKNSLGVILDKKERVSFFKIWKQQTHVVMPENWECYFNFGYNCSTVDDNDLLFLLGDVISCGLIYKIESKT